jgi:hypothetical protein
MRKLLILAFLLCGPASADMMITPGMNVTVTCTLPGVQCKTLDFTQPCNSQYILVVL